MDVLIVDDDPQCRRMVARLVRQTNVDVIAEVADGIEALDLLEGIRVDLIITDCQMPRLDGMSLTRTLRARQCTIPIVMVSGHTDPAIVAQAHRAGVNAFFHKPLDGKLLLQFIHRLMPMAA
jgi:two-component system chemotaxis response regulator CheY